MNRFLTTIALLTLSVGQAHADVVWPVAGPYSGSSASIGMGQLEGIKQAVADINAAGGIKGQKIVLKTYDDACDPKQAVSVANKIVADGFRFALHGTCSGASLAAERVYLEEDVVVINAFSSNPKWTDEGGPTIFRANYRDNMAAGVVSDAIRKRYPRAKVAILHDKSSFGQRIAEDVRDRLNKAGMKEVLFDSYAPNDRDFSALVTRLKDIGAGVVFVGGYPVEIGLIARQMREAGLSSHLFAGDLSVPEFWKISGSAGEGALFAFPPDPRKDPVARGVLETIERSGVVVDGHAIYGYAAAQVLAQAMNTAGDTDPKSLADTLHKAEFKTVLGPWRFDSKGDIRNMYEVLYRWHNGKFLEDADAPHPVEK